MELGPSSITALADLIAPNEDSESDDDTPSNYYAKLTPASIGVSKSNSVPDKESTTNLAAKEANSNDIWGTEEVLDGAQYDDVYDTRLAPDYDIVYKQAVTSEDIFLGMGNKTPATASCEDMVITVKLPGSNFKDVNVDLTDKHLSVRSPKYKLGLHLPHPCDSKNGKAQWLSDKELLKITVQMKREYDMLNF